MLGIGDIIIIVGFFMVIVAGILEKQEERKAHKFISFKYGKDYGLRY